MIENKKDFLILNFNKNFDTIYSNINKEIFYKNNNKIDFDGFTFNLLLNLSMNLYNNDFAYFPKLKLQKLNKFDKSKSEIQNYLKEIFFNDNHNYLDLELMLDELESINCLKKYIDSILSNNELINLKKSEELLLLRWYLLDLEKIEIDEITTDLINKSFVFDNSKIKEKEEDFLIVFYNFFNSYFIFLLKFFELKLSNNLNNKNELILIFNCIWSFYSKLIIIVDEILSPLNEIINKNFNKYYINLPKYPKFSYFKFLMKLFYNNIYLNYKESLEKSFFYLLKVKKYEIMNKLNKTSEKTNAEDIIKKNLKEYVAFLEDISYNEVNINYNCYSELVCNNEIDLFKENLNEKSIKFLKKEFENFTKNPFLITKFFNYDLSLISELAIENIYRYYVDKMGKFYLNRIRKTLKLIIKKEKIIKKNKNEVIDKNILNIWLNKKTSDYFFKSDLNKIFNNNSNSNIDSDLSNNNLNLNNVNYLYNKNINKFKDLVEEFYKVEDLCNNIFLKMKNNDKLILEFNKKRGIPLDIENMKNLYDICNNNFDKNKIFQTKIEEFFANDMEILNNTYCSLDFNEKIENDNKIFNLPGYEKIIDEENEDDDDYFEELRL